MIVTNEPSTGRHWCLGLLIGAQVLVLGCHSIVAALHYNYSVSVVNLASEPIRVQPFTLFGKGSFNQVAVGLVIAKGEAGMSPYLYAPYERVTLKWKTTVTGRTGEATVKVVLPKAFTKNNGADIYFYIDPEKQSVRVAYRVFDAKGNLKLVE